jgi:broad specificity phosphatase PhoE
MRTKPGQHLSQAGVTLARQVGETMGEFERVVTSTMPRAFETAIAMGYAVDEQYEALGMVDDGVQEEVGWDNSADWDVSFGKWSTAFKLNGATTQYCYSLARLWYDLIANVPEGGSVLVISHGGIIEAGTIGLFPKAEHAAWGRFCDYCEGVRISFEGQKPLTVEILRVHD